MGKEFCVQEQKKFIYCKILGILSSPPPPLMKLWISHYNQSKKGLASLIKSSECQAKKEILFSSTLKEMKEIKNYRKNAPTWKDEALRGKEKLNFSKVN